MLKSLEFGWTVIQLALIAFYVLATLCLFAMIAPFVK